MNITHTLFFIINLLVFCLLVLPATPINITLWWLENLLNLQIQWSLLALSLFITNLFYIKKLRICCLCLYVPIIYLNFAPLYVANPINTQEIKQNNQQQSTQFTIAQLNLTYNNPYLLQLLPLLGDKKFTLLVLQEVSDLAFNDIKQLTRYYPYSFGLSPLEATPSGMVIFSRWPIIEKIIHNIADHSTQILEIIIQIPNSVIPIQIYALHPGSPMSKERWQLRNKTLATTAQYVAHSPFVNKMVIGDFNSSPWSNAFRALQKNSQLKSSAQGFGYIPSWSYSNRFLLSLLSSVYIDHNLTSDSFKVLNKQYLSIPGSDHQLLFTKLEI